MKREPITCPTAAPSTVRRAGFQACVWLVSQDHRVWKILWRFDIVLQFSPAAAAAVDADTGGPPPLSARVFLTFLPAGAAAGARDEIPTSLIVRPPTDDL